MGMQQGLARSLDEGSTHLLAAARLIFAAAGASEQFTTDCSFDDGLDERLVEADLKALLWQVVALLPPGLRLDRDQPGRGHEPASDQLLSDDHKLRTDDLRSYLDQARRELHRIPPRHQKAEIADLLAALISLLARLDVTTVSYSRQPGLW